MTMQKMRGGGNAGRRSRQLLPPSAPLKTIPRSFSVRFRIGRLLPFRLLLVICGICVICGWTFAAQKVQHNGTKVEGYATVVTSDSITVFDKKNQLIEIHTGKDYSALVGIAAPVTVWYTIEGGVNLLEDIVYPTKAAEFVPPDLIRDQIRRIIILPRPEGVDDSPGLVKAISDYLAQTRDGTWRNRILPWNWPAAARGQSRRLTPSILAPAKWICRLIWNRSAR